MTRFPISQIIGTAALGLLLAAAPAEAQNLVSYVSNVTGDNANSCSSPQAPCADVPKALFKTEPGGEIKCLDNNLNGTVIINKPITIDCGAPGTVFRSLDGAVAITVDIDEATYPNGVVTLRNLNINGLLGNSIFGPGSDGVRVIGGGAAVHIENATIQGFAQQGIDFAPSSSVDLFVRDTTISNNAGGGVFVHPAAAATGVRGSLSNVRLDQNGISGLVVVKASGAGAVIAVEDTQVERDAVGLRANGASASILLSGSTVAHNTTGLQVVSGGKIVSSGNNTIFFNTTNGAPTSTVSLK